MLMPPPVISQVCSMDRHWNTLDVTFVNDSPKPVRKVRFAVTTASGVLTMVDDVGQYAPGEIVRHRLRTKLKFLYIYGNTRCVPVSVRFQDGTTWKNPSVPSKMEQALPQTPRSDIAFSQCFVGNAIYMNFRNIAQESATEVDLGLVQHDLLVARFREKGTFSPGTLIRREFGYGSMGNVLGDDMMRNRCIVLGVHYLSGATWSNPSPPPQALKGIPFTVTPEDSLAPLTILGCRASSSSSDYNGDWSVTYRNTSSKPMVSADFAIVMHGVIEAAAQDLHNLAPGDGNTTRFLLDDPHVYHPRCVPLRATYADGSTWINPLFASKANPSN